MFMFRTRFIERTCQQSPCIRQGSYAAGYLMAQIFRSPGNLHLHTDLFYPSYYQWIGFQGTRGFSHQIWSFPAFPANVPLKSYHQADADHCTKHDSLPGAPTAEAISSANEAACFGVKWTLWKTNSLLWKMITFDRYSLII